MKPTYYLDILAPMNGSLGALMLSTQTRKHEWRQRPPKTQRMLAKKLALMLFEAMGAGTAVKW